MYANGRIKETPMMPSLDTRLEKKMVEAKCFSVCVASSPQLPCGPELEHDQSLKSVKIRLLLRLLPYVRSLDVTIAGNIGFNSLTISHIVSNFINILRFKFTIKFFYSQSSQADKKYCQ